MYRFLDAEELVERLNGPGTRKPVRGPDGWSSLGVGVRFSHRFHLRCKSRCRWRGYLREFGTSNLPFRNAASQRLFSLFSSIFKTDRGPHNFFLDGDLDEYREKMQSFQANSGLYAVR